MDHYIVCGDDALARRVQAELTEHYRVPVVALRTADEESLRRASVTTARGIVLLEDDAETLPAALRIRALNPEIRIVLDLHDARLGNQLVAMLGDCAVLSRSAIVAPAFVEAALGRPRSVRVGGRTVGIAVDGEIRSEDALWAVAEWTDDPSVMRLLSELPPPLDEATRQEPREGTHRAVLQFQDREPAFSPPRPARLQGLLISLWRFLTGTKTGVALSGFAAVVPAALVLLFAVIRPAAQAEITVTAVPVTAVVTAALVAVALRRQGDGPRAPSAGTRDHVVVVGLGGVGARVATHLHDLGVPVVGVERYPDAVGVAVARTRNIPAIVGDGPFDELLHRAHVGTARAVIAVEADDTMNLRAALAARAANPDLRAVLRLADDDIAAYVHRTLPDSASRSVPYLAAPAFAAALLGITLLGTLPVDRHVLLVAEIRVGSDSPVAGVSVAGIGRGGDLRVIAVSFEDGRYDWRPRDNRRMDAGDRLVVIATRTGLASFVASHGSMPEETAAGEFTIAVYLDDAEQGPAVRRAVEAYLGTIGAEIVADSVPVLGSWSWFARAKRVGRAAVQSEAGTLAESIAWGPVRSRQADINLVNSQAAMNLVNSLSGTSCGAIHVGSLLVVKNNGVPIVLMLSQEQVNQLERRPVLLSRPETLLEDLQRTWTDDPDDGDLPSLTG